MHDFFGMRIVPIYTVRFLMDSFITDLNIVLRQKKKLSLTFFFRNLTKMWKY